MADFHDRRLPSPTPGAAIAEQGAVLLEGPGGVVLALTPEAAILTGESLRRAARAAERQRPTPIVPLRPGEETS